MLRRLTSCRCIIIITGTGKETHYYFRIKRNTLRYSRLLVVLVVSMLYYYDDDID